MKSEYRSLVAIALSIAVLILWFTVINPPQKRVEVQDQNAASQMEQVQKPAAAPARPRGAEAETEKGVLDPQAKLPVKTWTIRNELMEADLTSDGAVATSWRMLKYQKGTSSDSAPIELAGNAEGLIPALSLSFNDASFAFPARPRFELVAADESKAVFVWRSPEVIVTKTISIAKDSYLADVAVEVKNLTARPQSAKAGLSWNGVVAPPKESGFFGFLKQPSQDNVAPVYYLDGSTTRVTNAGKAGEVVEKTGRVMWSGLENRYFIGAIVPRVQGEGLVADYGIIDITGGAAGEKGLWAGAVLPAFTAPPGDWAKANFSVYAGPKDIGQLKEVGVKLEEAIDYGWFTVIAVPILYVLKFLYGLIHNYGIAIIILTILAKLLLHPINVKSLKSMKAMQQLQPKLKELQSKFKDDKQRLNQETMQLFRAHKVNPAGGCLPMLLQFPIYIALYKVLWNSIELYHAPFFWFYRDLSSPDPYFITPILLGLFMVAQQKLTPTASADPAQQKMMMLMPIMFSVFMLFLPVGLVVYILVNTVMSVTQQWMYNKGIRYRDLVRGKWLPAQ